MDDARVAVGVDLGQTQDYTAIVVAETTGGVHRIVHLERIRLGTSYPDVVRRVAQVCAALQTPPVLAIDQTGVGRAVVDMFNETRPRCAALLAVTITAGEGATRQPDGSWHIAKKDLVAVVQVALQNRRLHVARSLPDAGTLTKELLGFRAKITAAGNVTYGTPDWREGAHDDLVLATALALWAGNAPRPNVRLIEYDRRPTNAEPAAERGNWHRW